jgi:hypothetical protein
MSSKRFCFCFASRHVLGLALLVLGAGIGCSGPPPPTPQAFIFSQVGPNPNNPNACNLGVTQSWVSFGSDGMSVQDGTSFNGAGVSVTCSVVQNGSHNYTVDASAKVTAQGSIHIVQAKLSDDDTMAQTPVQAIFQSATGNYKQTDCTFDINDKGKFTSGMFGVNEPMNPNMGIAPGRVWGNITCPTATDQSLGGKSCLATAEIKFEDCSQ